MKFLSTFLLMLTASICMGTFHAIAQESYIDSPLSDENYKVTEILSSGKLAACSVVTFTKQPQFFLMLTPSSGGTIAVNAIHFKLKSNELVLSSKVKIGERSSSRVYIVDGNIATFELPKSDLIEAFSRTIAINSIPIEQDTFRKTYQLAKSCLNR